MLDFWLITALGFLGSFGHCAGMCGPLTVAFGLSNQPNAAKASNQQIFFHVALNLGRIASYALVGLGIGALGSLMMASGQLAGVGSTVRRIVALLTGGSLVWLGLVQINPKLLPMIPLLNPMASGTLHDRLSRSMMQLSFMTQWWTPVLLGMVWGLMPCGFLYVAQIKAAETGSAMLGMATMLAFGIGTLPTMLGVGISASLLSRDRRSQLFRMGGWITLTIGLLTLMRTGDVMVDATGHLALGLLILALVARPLRSLGIRPLQYRRAIGVSAFVLAVAHSAHMMDHLWGWNLEAFAFMVLRHQLGLVSGAIALGLMTPAALTSFDWAQTRLGRLWKGLHWLCVPALLFCAAHCFLIGTHYLGRAQLTWVNYACTAGLAIAVLGVLLVRSPRFNLFQIHPSNSGTARDHDSSIQAASNSDLSNY